LIPGPNHSFDCSLKHCCLLRIILPVHRANMLNTWLDSTGEEAGNASDQDLFDDFNWLLTGRPPSPWG
jgi:hypothetical protein